MKLENIKKAYTENTGGGCLVDFLELENGLLLAVSDEYVGLYKTVDDLYEGDEITGFWIKESLHNHQLDTKERYLEDLNFKIANTCNFFADLDSGKIVHERTGTFCTIKDGQILFKYSDGIANEYDWQIPFFLSYDLQKDTTGFLNLAISSISNFTDSQ